jgi:hypothetical protein
MLTALTRFTHKSLQIAKAVLSQFFVGDGGGVVAGTRPSLYGWIGRLVRRFSRLGSRFLGLRNERRIFHQPTQDVADQ